MDNITILTLVVLAIGLLLLGGVLGWFLARRQRSHQLRQQFGPEYAQAVHEAGDRDAAEVELEARQARVKRLALRSLSAEEREHYAAAWQAIQVQFVDQPAAAVAEAQQLVTEVMQERGYPMAEFDQRLADLSVDHGPVVQDYRAAREIARKNEQHQASTEQLRQAMVHYRALVAALVEVPDIQNHNHHKEATVAS